MFKEIICTVCPRGCHITVEGEGEKILNVEGYICKRGLEYASAEFAHPIRILTTTVKMAGVSGELLPVRSNAPLPKEKLFDCMEVIRKVEVALPVARYDVVVENICGTGVDIVATKAVK
jgi:CxxC motif-containing protein